MNKIQKAIFLLQLSTYCIFAQTNNTSLIPEMVLITGGIYDMGDIFNEGAEDEKPIHKVEVKSFYLGKYEVTQKEWVAIMGINPSITKNDDFPIEMVSWDEVQLFIKKLNEKTGKKYRLPTEAEWEYAAREGGKKVRYGNGKNIASIEDINFNGGSKKNDELTLTKIGSYNPNALGLYDMSGNVWEWCQDIYDVYLSKTPPKYPYHVIRGGCYGGVTRVTARYRFAVKNNGLGFRLAIDKI